VFTGATCPAAISRSEASPEAETTWYCPEPMRFTASSEGAEGLDADLATGLFLERSHPVDLRVGRAVLGIPGPGDHAERVLVLAEFLGHLQVRGG
jgi:hypothetical protein